MAAWVQVSSAVHSMLLFVCFWHRAIGTAAFFLALALTGCLLQYWLLPLSQDYYLDQEHIHSTGSVHAIDKNIVQFCDAGVAEAGS